MTQTTDTPTLRAGSIPAWPADARTRTFLQEHLNGVTLAPTWLPDGTGWDTMDALRDEHHRLLRATAAAADALNDREREWADSDKYRQEALLQAHQTGDPAPDDERLTESERAEARKPLVENVHAALKALATHVQRATAAIAEHEAEWLPELAGRMGEVDDMKREARVLMDQARTREHTLDTMGRWIQRTSDGKAFHLQPAPSDAAGPPAPNWKPIDPYAFERHWAKRPEAQAGFEPNETVIDIAPDADPDDDDTSLIEPLDPEDRYAA